MPTPPAPQLPALESDLSRALAVLEAARALLTAIADEESNRDGEMVLGPDTRCGVCTVGVRHERLCARHRLARLVGWK